MAILALPGPQNPAYRLIEFLPHPVRLNLEKINESTNIIQLHFHPYKERELFHLPLFKNRNDPKNIVDQYTNSLVQATASVM